MFTQNDAYRFYDTKPEAVPEDIIGYDDWQRMLTQFSLVTIPVEPDNETHGSPNRAHSIWVGSEFPPDPIKRPKTAGFAENVASLKKFNSDYNQVLWIDKNDFDALSTTLKDKTIDYCRQNNITLIPFQDIFPVDEIEQDLFNIYNIERAEGNFAAATDALRVMILRRFRGLYIDTDNAVKQGFDQNAFSSNQTQYHIKTTDEWGLPLKTPSVNNDLISVPRSATNEIELVAKNLINFHKRKLVDVFSTQEAKSTSIFASLSNLTYNANNRYLMIPYQYVRREKALRSTGPHIFAVTLRNIESREIDKKYFTTSSANTWLGDKGLLTYENIPDIPEYRFLKSTQQNAKQPLKNLLLYHHYLESRTLRFDFFRLDMTDWLNDHNENLESIIFKELLSDKNFNFNTVEYVAFSFIDTFNQHYKNFLDRDKFPNLRLSLYLPEFLYLIQKGTISFDEIETKLQNSNQQPEVKFFLDVLKSLAQGKSLEDLQTDSSKDKAAMSELSEHIKNKVPQAAFFKNEFKTLSENFFSATDKKAARQALLDFLRSDSFQFLLTTLSLQTGEKRYRDARQALAEVLQKALETKDTELINELVKNNISISLTKVTPVLQYMKQGLDNKTNHYLAGLIISNNNSIEKVEAESATYDENDKKSLMGMLIYTILSHHDTIKTSSTDASLFLYADRQNDTELLEILKKKNFLSGMTLDTLFSDIINASSLGQKYFIEALRESWNTAEIVKTKDLYDFRQALNESMRGVFYQDLFVFKAIHADLQKEEASSRSQRKLISFQSLFHSTPPLSEKAKILKETVLSMFDSFIEKSLDQTPNDKEITAFKNFKKEAANLILSYGLNAKEKKEVMEKINHLEERMALKANVSTKHT